MDIGAKTICGGIVLKKNFFLFFSLNGGPSLAHSDLYWDAVEEGGDESIKGGVCGYPGSVSTLEGCSCYAS